ncbi:MULTISPECIES: N-acetylneuraminate synthase family protein [unclassified Flavobacterium]|uniref:N-acetylneuraminate synthase family protein n=1 Tax=Flavobacterium sp. 81 TaxID=2135621 RepID=UPI000EADFF98
MKYLTSTGKPIFFSTAIFEQSDIELVLQACKKNGNEDITLLKFPSRCPVAISAVNMWMIKNLTERYNVTCGLSNHTTGSIVPILITCFGVKIIEKDLC